MKTKIILIFAFTMSLFFFYPTNSYSQKIIQNKEHKFSVSAGYGLAGGFSVTDYQESLPFPSSGYKSFMNKKFIGNGQELLVGYKLNKNYEIKAGINLQHFSRHIKATDTLSSVIIYLDKKIHHQTNIYSASLNRVFEKPNYLLTGGIGLYYLREQAKLIDYGYGLPNFYVDRDYNYQNSNEEEGGAFIEFSYEYKFQPRVNLGIKTQLYYTISIASFESITLLPFIKISL